jgi:predicted metal-binding protein
MDKKLAEKIVELGAYNAGFIEVSEIPFDRELRKSCEMNYCGNYNKNWTCPPMHNQFRC